MTEIAATLLRLVLMPPLNLLVLATLGWLLQRRWPRFGRALAAGSLVALLVVSTSAGALLLVAPLEERTAPLELAAAATAGAGAIVVLGAGAVESAPEYGGRAVPDAVALVRLQYAAHLQHVTGLPLMTSGGNASVARGVPPKAATMARTLTEDFRTPVTWIEDRSEDTAENASRSAALLKAAGIKRILLVTHAMHMPRARAAFARQGIEVIDAPTLFYSRMRWSPTMLLPSASGLYRSYYAMHEWIGLGWYRLRAMRE